MKRQNPLLRLAFWVLLLSLGFVVGTAWKSDTITTQGNQGDTATEPTLLQPANQDAPSDTRNITPRRKLNPDELATIELFEKAAPSVTFITTSNVMRDRFTMNLTEIPRGTGSGFVWDKKGHIVTNFHVIRGADRAMVTLADRSSWPAKLVGQAPEKDLAVLLIDAPAAKLLPIPLGESEDLLVGQSVYAIGNPFGLDQSLTTGIISALGREIESQAGIPIRGAIQTDAAINPGNSGGPLLDSSGRLIGVNTAIYSPSGAYAGIGFSIPVGVVNWVVPDLIKFGKVIRPILGVEVANSSVSRRLGVKGVLIIEVVKGSAAERAGIRPTLRNRYGSIVLGDVIVAINDEEIKTGNDLILTLEKYRVGDRITLTVIREDKLIEIPLTLDASR